MIWGHKRKKLIYIILHSFENPSINFAENIETFKRKRTFQFAINSSVFLFDFSLNECTFSTQNLRGENLRKRSITWSWLSIVGREET